MGLSGSLTPSALGFPAVWHHFAGITACRCKQEITVLLNRRKKLGFSTSYYVDLRFLFDWKMWGEVLTDPVSWGLIGSLVLLEGPLSADNALVLAVMVRHLPEKQRKKALTYGLFGAYIFRFIFIGIGIFAH